MKYTKSWAIVCGWVDECWWALTVSQSRELEGLRTSGAVVSLTCATKENLELLKKAFSHRRDVNIFCGGWFWALGEGLPEIEGSWVITNII